MRQASLPSVHSKLSQSVQVARWQLAAIRSSSTLQTTDGIKSIITSHTAAYHGWYVAYPPQFRLRTAYEELDVSSSHLQPNEEPVAAATADGGLFRVLVHQGSDANAAEAFLAALQPVARHELLPLGQPTTPLTGPVLAWAEEIDRARSLSCLLTLVRQQFAGAPFTCWALVLFKGASLLASSSRYARQELDDFADSVLTVLSATTPHFQSWSFPDLSLLLFALGKVGFYDPVIVPALVQATQEVLASTPCTANVKAAVGKTVIDKTAVDKAAANKTAAEKAEVEKIAVEKKAIDKTAVDKIVGNETRSKTAELSNSVGGSFGRAMGMGSIEAFGPTPTQGPMFVLSNAAPNTASNPHFNVSSCAFLSLDLLHACNGLCALRHWPGAAWVAAFCTASLQLLPSSIPANASQSQSSYFQSGHQPSSNPMLSTRSLPTSSPPSPLRLPPAPPSTLDPSLLPLLLSHLSISPTRTSLLPAPQTLPLPSTLGPSLSSWSLPNLSTASTLPSSPLTQPRTLLLTLDPPRLSIPECCELLRTVAELSGSNPNILGASVPPFWLHRLGTVILTHREPLAPQSLADFIWALATLQPHSSSKMVTHPTVLQQALDTSTETSSVTPLSLPTASPQVKLPSASPHVELSSASPRLELQAPSSRVKLLSGSPGLWLQSAVLEHQGLETKEEEPPIQFVAEEKQQFEDFSDHAGTEPAADSEVQNEYGVQLQHMQYNNLQLGHMQFAHTQQAPMFKNQADGEPVVGPARQTKEPLQLDTFKCQALSGLVCDPKDHCQPELAPAWLQEGGRDSQGEGLNPTHGTHPGRQCASYNHHYNNELLSDAQLSGVMQEPLASSLQHMASSSQHNLPLLLTEAEEEQARLFTQSKLPGLLIAAVQEQLPFFTPSQLPQLLWGLARLGCTLRSSRSFLGFQHLLLQQVQYQLSFYTEAEVANTVWALASLGVQPPTPWVQAVLLRTSTQLPQMSVSHLSQLMWAMSKFRHRPYKQWIFEVCARLRLESASITKEELVSLSEALSSLHIQPNPETLSHLVQRMRSLLPFMTKQDLQVMVDSYTQLFRILPSRALRQAVKDMRERMPYLQ